MSVEREVKLLAPGGLDEDAILATVREAGFEAVPGGTRRQADTYLDSEEFDCARAGGGLRVRECGESASVEWKGPGIEGDALFRRVEISADWGRRPLPTRAGELPGPLRAQVEPLAYARLLATVARLSTTRETFTLLHPASGGRAELCLDRVEGQLASSDPQVFEELEIEILEGDSAPWSALAETLRARLGLEPSTSNKLRHVARLAGAELPGRGEAESVSAGQPYQAAALVIFRRHLAKLESEEPGTRLREHVERLHKMRVATRRLRASFRTFAGAFSPETLQPWDELMRKTGRALGFARDLDVLLESLPELGSHLPAALQEDLVPFASMVEELRDAEQGKLLRWLESSRRLKGFERFERFTREGARRADRLGLRVGQIAPGLILHEARRVYSKGERITPASPDKSLHALRIAMKRLRYTLEAFLDVYGKPLRSFISDATDLQEVLGNFNDASVQVAFIKRLVEERGRKLPRQTLLAVGALIGVIASRGERARGEFEAIWKGFDRPRTRKKLESAVSARW